jgi:hypothetical protein
MIRQTHRCLGIAFTLGAIINVIAYTVNGPGNAPAFWVNFLALIPMALLLLSGLYLFALPYIGKRSRG